MAIWTEPLNAHLELYACSSKSNIDTVGSQYVFSVVMTNHTLKERAVIWLSVGLVLISFRAFIGYLPSWVA